ncbi:hypothetical protein DPMN_122844 [Dreissena polymorpha]|uniref:Uncharacterized protein n=1 Tax=Dreissena polymorpha TaxID=45954 RepID=A0A9D4GWA4_DREPO|nr:hypothetical protein DPMN_122844 [Dreissena polymorpha]
MLKGLEEHNESTITMLENEQGKYGAPQIGAIKLRRCYANRYDLTTETLRSKRSATKQLELRRTGTDRKERTTTEHCAHNPLYCHTQNASQKDNMQSTSTARTRNNGISGVWGRVYLLHPKPRAGSS